MKDGRCNMHYRGARCENAWGHKQKKHRFLINGEYVWRDRKQISEWLSHRKECGSPGKVAHRERHKAQLASIRQALLTGKEFRTYLCECGNYHLREEYQSTKKTLREVRNA